MGFFSWKTQDTDRSIRNMYAGDTFTVYMMDDKGNKWEETCYEGYGDFGGKDYYDLLAEMNPELVEKAGIAYHSPFGCEERNTGIHLALGVCAIKNKETGEVLRGQGYDFFNWDVPLFNGKSANSLVASGEWERITIREEGTKYPNLVEDPNWEWRNEQPEDCEFQGYFYDEEEEEYE